MTDGDANETKPLFPVKTVGVSIFCVHSYLGSCDQI